MVSAAVARVAERDGLAKRRIERLIDLISGFDTFLDGLGFCLSEEPDQLGQWRGYADDGLGVAIGYSKEYLERLASHLKDQHMPSFTLGQAEYEAEKHDEHVEPTYRKAKDFIDQGALDFPRPRGLLDTRNEKERELDRKRWEQLFQSMSITMLSLFTKLYLLKSPAFREEKEWRLVAYRGKESDEECEFDAARDRIVPYRAFELHDLGASPITKVVLGPKHITPIVVIEDFLKISGYRDVEVERSAASYR